MTASVIKKNKITLSDYPYRRDIENRLLIATLSNFEVELLREMLSGSLKIDIRDLTDVFNCRIEQIETLLDKLANSKLFKREGAKILIDKEMRKYYEFQLEKFEKGFKADVVFLQQTLNKVPIHILPNWYVLPKTSDHIFSAIIEKYLLTPKIYLRYLQELQFDDPVMDGMLADIMQHPEGILAQGLREKYGLTYEQFEEAMLHMEFNFAAFLCYRFEQGTWKEVVMPLYEWQEYASYKKAVNQRTKLEDGNIENKQADFCFINQIDTLLEKSLRGASPVGSLQEAAKKIAQISLGRCEGDAITAYPEAREWLRMQITEKALALYRHPANLMEGADENMLLYSEKNIRAVEKSLRKAAMEGWVYFDEFMKSFVAALHKTEGVSLKQKGKQWKYVIPIYSPEELAFAEQTIFERLYQIGIVDIGTHAGRKCFRVTPFGRIAIGE